jgi:type 1 glutamine amidotransferase
MISTNRHIPLMLLPALCGLETTAAMALAGGSEETSRILVFSRTEGFRHDSIAAGIGLVETLGQANGFAVDATEDAAAFTAPNLAKYRAVVFLNSTGDVFDPAQETAFENYLRGGGGFVGVHSAADTEHGWPFFGEVLGGGAWISVHPPIQSATLVVESHAELSVAHLPPTFSFTDEWYNFQANPRALVTVLMSIDESSYSPGAGAMGDHPITWQHQIDSGRCWYTNLGHRIETYADSRFRQLLLGGILWSARLEVFHDGFESGDTSGWSLVTP